MGQLVVRKIENAVKAKLRRRAKQHGWSMEEEVRDILRGVADEDAIPTGGLGAEIASLFRRSGIDADIAEFKGRQIKPPRFEP